MLFDFAQMFLFNMLFCIHLYYLFLEIFLIKKYTFLKKAFLGINNSTKIVKYLKWIHNSPGNMFENILLQITNKDK